VSATLPKCQPTPIRNKVQKFFGSFFQKRTASFASLAFPPDELDEWVIRFYSQNAAANLPPSDTATNPKQAAQPPKHCTEE
jgi:hypothetical protein